MQEITPTHIDKNLLFVAMHVLTVYIPTEPGKFNENIRNLKDNSKHNQRDPKNNMKQTLNRGPKIITILSSAT